MSRFAVLFAAILFPYAATSEVTCSDSVCFDSVDSQPVAEPVEAELRAIADKYLAVLKSEFFEESTEYWKPDSAGQPQTRLKLQKLRDSVGFVPDDETTVFRQMFSVSEANGRTGYFIVIEYGTRTGSFDVIQHIVWELESEHWQIVCHGYVYRCPPDSTPVDLSSDNSLH